MKLIKFSFAFLCVLCCFSGGHAQTNINIKGEVTDLATRKSIDSVTISLKDSSLKTTSDTSGAFCLTLRSSQFTCFDSIKVYFYCEGENLCWKSNIPVSIRLLDINGNVLSEQKEYCLNGVVSTGKLQTNLFFINIVSSGMSQTYKAFFIAGELFVSDRTQKSNTYEINTDSLYFHKNNYYDRVVAIDSSILKVNKLLYVSLLNKSNDTIHYINELINRNVYDLIKNSPPKSTFTEVESVKLLFDTLSGLVYYINSKLYTEHYKFAVTNLGYSYSHARFVGEQYNAGRARYLYPVILNYYKDLDIYTFEFFSGDGASCKEVQWCYEKILATSYLRDNLYFYSTNASWDKCTSVPSVTPNDIFNGQNYQVLNVAEGYGYLRKIPFENIYTESIQKHDIVLTNGIPIDIPVVSGLITTEFQTPLSHVNVLSHNRGTPNMALRDGFENTALDSLLNQLVHIVVSNDSFHISRAVIDDAFVFWNSREPSETIILEKDTITNGLVFLEQATIQDINKIGGKAANYAELIRAFTSIGEDAPVPENHFAIPFYYYQKHIEANGLEAYISEMLQNKDFVNDIEVRKKYLKILQDSIIHSKLDPELLAIVTNQLRTDSRFSAYRFRSSTNAEDIEGFNGAGLYESFTGKLDNDKKSIEEAIKKVWASLWYYPAFEERAYYKIDQLSCAMGILVQRTFVDEDANGVAITTNPYNSNAAFVVNVQFGETSIVSPPPNVINDEVVVYLFSILGVDPYTIEYNSFSNLGEDPNEHVLSKKELFALADYITTIRNYFFFNVYPCDCKIHKFGLDIEFKVDSSISPRKIYIKQVRPY